MFIVLLLYVTADSPKTFTMWSESRRSWTKPKHFFPQASLAVQKKLKTVFQRKLPSQSYRGNSSFTHLFWIHLSFLLIGVKLFLIFCSLLLHLLSLNNSPFQLWFFVIKGNLLRERAAVISTWLLASGKLGSDWQLFMFIMHVGCCRLRLNALAHHLWSL